MDSSKKLDGIGLHCPECSYQTIYQVCLKTHIQNEHPKDIKIKKPILINSSVQSFICFRCEGESFKATSIESLHRHVQLVHSDEGKKNYPHQCNQCDFKARTFEKLGKHSQTHNNEYMQLLALDNENFLEKKKDVRSLHLCPDCEFETYDKEGLFIHRRDEHSLKLNNLVNNIDKGASADEVEEFKEKLVDESNCRVEKPLPELISNLQHDWSDDDDEKPKVDLKSKNPILTTNNTTLNRSIISDYSLEIKKEDETGLYSKAILGTFQNISSDKLPPYNRRKRMRKVSRDMVSEYALKNSIKEKLLDNSNTESLKCKYCKFVAVRPQGLLVHTIYKHPAEKNDFKCSFCEFETNDLDKLDKHLQSDHSTDDGNMITSETYECGKCNFVCEDFYEHEIHMKTHTIDLKAELSNEDCEDLTTDSSEIQAQNEDDSVSDDEALKFTPKRKTFSCALCDYETDDQLEWRCHKKLHPKGSKENPVKYIKPLIANKICPHCNKVILRPLHLHILAKHTNVKPIKCDLCEYSTKTYQDLQQHRKKHSKDEILHCNECDFQTHIKHYYVLHMERHRSGDSLSCDICSYQTWRHDILLNHRKRRHPHLYSLKMVECPHCSYSFPNSMDLRKHYKRNRKCGEKEAESHGDSILGDENVIIISEVNSELQKELVALKDDLTTLQDNRQEDYLMWLNDSDVP